MADLKTQVIVVGGGHAGYEAALASARMGVKTTLVTLDRSQIGRLPCNPAVGGIAKSHLVSEVDSMGGEIAKNADFTGVQYRMLNTRKGPAVQSNRIQCDKIAYPLRIQEVLKNQANLSLIDDMVTSIDTHNGKIKSITTRSYGTIYANCIVICTGTFLRGRVLIGTQSIAEGRMGEESSESLSESFQSFGFSLARLKTGTPPRIHSDSIAYDRIDEQPGEDPPPLFSYDAKQLRKNSEKEMFHVEQSKLIPWIPGDRQLSCYLTHTNPQTHQIIADHLHESAMYGGMIEGTGVRYCPSIEDKIVKFSGRDAHHVFIEPEGRNNVRLYPNGTSNSLPEEVQLKMIRSIVGMEQAEMIRPGYAIEYDFADPTQLFHSLETKKVENLFFAGQLNGTTGYEEASAQGFVAGVNAACKVLGKSEFTLSRNESYIGVLIDDLVTKGTDEPYRMFTSRSEHRLTLRQDNAPYRLYEKASRLQILNKDRLLVTKYQMDSIKKEVQRLEKTFSGGKSLAQLLRQPGNTYDALPASLRECEDEDVMRQVEIEVKYAGYIKRERERIETAQKQESWRIPIGFDYDSVGGLRAESLEKLKRVLPENLGQAGRISGVIPSDVALLSVAIKKLEMVLSADTST
ncbi:MAG TPA: tRNA uridine-5-carboxymethylaminomethyl(34) synthesis enzyme MnmG [Verrucomicrobia bacterium]|nr:tRNA uridine-5-carboxymethylaminomethyl(34) synthesis enzyme MnmG [Verrucomicrobiota bacterium]